MKSRLHHTLLACVLTIKLACTVANPDFRPEPVDDVPPPPDGADTFQPDLPPVASASPDVAESVDAVVRQATDHTPRCTLETYFPDLDHDGFGDSQLAVQACQAPAGHVADGGDCDDNDANVHPGQAGFFASASLGSGTHDYNCDGAVELASPSLSVGCSVTPCAGEGWAVDVPTCGEWGFLTRCVPYLGLGCGPWVVWEVQRCR